GGGDRQPRPGRCVCGGHTGRRPGGAPGGRPLAPPQKSGDALERLLNRKQKYLRQAVTGQVAVDAVSAIEKSETAQDPSPASVDGTSSPRTQPAAHARRLQRLARYNEIKTLHQQGVSIHEIAKRLRMSRRTIRHWVRADHFPARAQKPR